MRVASAPSRNISGSFVNEKVISKEKKEESGDEMKLMRVTCSAIPYSHALLLRCEGYYGEEGT